MYYSKIVRQVACKMALLLALMFAACSNDDTKQPTVAHDGGYTEETGIYPFSGHIGNKRPKLMKLSGDVPQSKENTLSVDKGTIFTIYELDSTTLNKTGRFFVDTIDNDDGRFSFTDLVLNSPYILIEIQDSCTASECQQRGLWGSQNYPTIISLPCNYDSLSTTWYGGVVVPPSCEIEDTTKYRIPLGAIIDLRNHYELSVNSLTNLKIPLVQKYYAQGISFVEANKKAEKEILENFGVYEDLGSFEDSKNVTGELSYVLELIVRIVREQSLFYAYLSMNIKNFGTVPKAAITALGDTVEQLFLNTLKLFEYETGYIAHTNNLGQCTESRENETYLTNDLIAISIVCHSNKWIAGNKRVDYETGTMVDNRDGKTYNTVTYNWNGVKQTWLAENLNFADTTSPNIDSSTKKILEGNTRCNENDPSCEIYGRYYTWRAAMNLEWSSIRMTSVKAYAEYDEENDIETVTYDTILVEDTCLPDKYYESAFDYRYISAYGNDSSNRYEYCTETSDNGECLNTSYASTVELYCQIKYGNWGCRVDASNFIAQAEPKVHQGICPDRWRIPNETDWKILSENMTQQGAALTDAEGSGFGYAEQRSFEIVNSDPPELRVQYPMVIPNIKYALVPEANQIDVLTFNISNGYPTLPTTSREDRYGPLGFESLNIEVYVRCIKD